MAIENKRMQQRYGPYSKFLADKGKLLPNEFAAVTSGDPNSGTGKGLYFAFGAGDAEQLMTYQNGKRMVDNAMKEIQSEFLGSVKEATANANTATKNTTSATATANSASKAALAAAEEARTAVWNNKNLTDRHVGSHIKVEGTVASSAVIREIKGVTEQETTNGVNLLQYPYSNSTITVNGITFTDNGDGSITLNGTATENADFSTIELRTNRLNLEIGKTYTISCCGMENYTDAISFVVQDETSVQGTKNFGTFVARFEKYYSWIRVYAGKTVNNVTVKPQIQEGDTATPWEPFTGGKPSPNPDYPQEIKSVGTLNPETGKYEVRVKAHHKNFFDMDYAWDRVTYDNNTGTLKQDNSTNTVASNLKVQTFKNGKWQKDFIITSAMGYFSYTFVKDDTFDGVRIGFNGNKEDGLCQTFIKENGTYTISCTVESLALNAGIISGIMLSKGSEALPFAPYKQSLATIELDSLLYEGDKIFLEDGDVWVERENGHGVYDGSKDEEIGSVGSNSENTRKYYAIKIGELRYAVSDGLRTNRLKTEALASSTTNVSAWIINSETANACRLCVRFEKDFENTEAFKTYLSSHPLIAVYKLAEPTKEKLSQSSIYGLRSFDGLTYIEVLDDIEPEITVDVAKTPEGAYLLEGFCAGKKSEIQIAELREAQTAMLADTMALLPPETQAAMIENDTNNLLSESEVI